MLPLTPAPTLRRLLLGFSHPPIDYASPDPGARAIPSEEEAAGSDGAKSDNQESSDQDLQRKLAFAYRARASGSGLPPLLAQFYGAVEEMDDFDDEDADDIVESLVLILETQREILKKYDTFLESVVPSVFHRAGHIAVWRKDYRALLNEDKGVFKMSLVHLAAFRKIGASYLGTTSAQGLLPMRPDMVNEKERPARSLRNKLIKYHCESDIYVACKHYGIPYTKPHEYHVKPDANFSGKAFLAESGHIGPRRPKVSERSR
ncbi:hypothetical protein C8Q70DRAFT_331469 [Cubamyces menziesii]|nr:hypothetical protein C8Q70DRAFT_331469 [Cubamyces menziesii]